MAGKHQIFSSKKSTRQKANRSWRRQDKLKTENQSQGDLEFANEQEKRREQFEQQKQQRAKHSGKFRTGGATTLLGPLLQEALRSGESRTSFDRKPKT